MLFWQVQLTWPSSYCSWLGQGLQLFSLSLSGAAGGLWDPPVQDGRHCAEWQRWEERISACLSFWGWEVFDEQRYTCPVRVTGVQRAEKGRHLVSSLFLFINNPLSLHPGLWQYLEYAGCVVVVFFFSVCSETYSFVEQLNNRFLSKSLPVKLSGEISTPLLPSILLLSPSVVVGVGIRRQTESTVAFPGPRCQYVAASGWLAGAGAAVLAAPQPVMWRQRLMGALLLGEYGPNQGNGW